MNDNPSIASLPSGFAGSYDDYIGKPLDLNRLLVQAPAATVFMRVAGDNMSGAGMSDGDILVVDRSLTPREGQHVVAIQDGEFIARLLEKRQGQMMLVSDTHALPINEQGCEIVGVITSLIRRFT